MAERRRVYNERFLYPDPLSAASKSTRHRALKKRKASERECDPVVSHAESISQPVDTGGATAERVVETVSNLQQTCETCFEDDVSECVAETELLDYFSLEEEIGEDVDQEETASDGEQCVGRDVSATVFINCPLTLTRSMLLLKKFQMRHHLTQDALADLLQLMRLHFPSPNCFPKSLYLFNQQSPVVRDQLEFTFFCSRCLQEIPDKDASICPNVSCGFSLTSERGAISSFIEVPLEPQLITLLQSMTCQLACLNSLVYVVLFCDMISIMCV